MDQDGPTWGQDGAQTGNNGAKIKTRSAEYGADIDINLKRPKSKTNKL